MPWAHAPGLDDVDQASASMAAGEVARSIIAYDEPGAGGHEGDTGATQDLR